MNLNYEWVNYEKMIFGKKNNKKFEIRDMRSFNLEKSL